MTGTVSFSDPQEQQNCDGPPPKRRSAFRQRLIEAERGLSVGLRSGSSLFGQMFFCLSILLTAGNFGLEAWEWVALIVSIIVAFAAELSYVTVQILSEELPGRKAYEAVRLSAAAMVLTVSAAALVIGTILFRRLMEILS